MRAGFGQQARIGMQNDLVVPIGERPRTDFSDLWDHRACSVLVRMGGDHHLIKFALESIGELHQLPVCPVGVKFCRRAFACELSSEKRWVSGARYSRLPPSTTPPLGSIFE